MSFGPLASDMSRSRPAGASWEFDVADAWALLDTSITRGGPGWLKDGFERFLARVRLIGVSDAALLLFDLPWDRKRVMGRPLGSLWPEAGLTALADLLASLATAEPDAMLTRAVDHMDRLDDVVLAGWRTGAAENRVFVSIQANLDTREPRFGREASQPPHSLISSVPVPLFDVDARAAGRVFARLRAEGVTDLEDYLNRRPDLVDTTCEIVVVTEANRDAAELMGAADACELLRPVTYLFSMARDTARRVMLAHFAGQRNYVEQAKIRTLDGRVRDVLVLVTFPVPGEQLDTTLLMMIDNTARLEAEARLRQVQADFSHAARLSTLGQMTASIAHEIKQPLSAILTNAETSLRWLAKEDPNLPKVTQLAERIAAGAQRATDIIARIQDMAGNRQPRHARLDFNEVVGEALSFVRHDSEERAIRMRVDLADDLPATIGERIQLQQVVVNLLVNSAQALEAIPPEDREIRVATCRDAPGSVALTIRDTGPGIPADHLERIFGGFFSTKANGMGIGLTICQSIVSAHGGTITAANAAEGGAEFRVVLPIEPPAS